MTSLKYFLQKLNVTRSFPDTLILAEIGNLSFD